MEKPKRIRVMHEGKKRTLRCNCTDDFRVKESHKYPFGTKYDCRCPICNYFYWYLVKEN